MNTSSSIKPVAVARMQVTRAATGDTEFHYSYEKVPFRQFRRWLKLHKHLRFMRREDRVLKKGLK